MTRTLRLTRQSLLAEGVLELRMQDPDGGELPAWEPGSHVTITLPDGTARDYSLCGDPADRTQWTVAVLRESSSRGGSAYVHERLRVGDLVEIDGPRNNFALQQAQHYLLIAGGIGVTPIKAMAEQLARRGAEFQLVYCGRERARMAYLAELRAALGDRMTVHCDDEHDAPVDLDALLVARPDSAAVYCCGPEPLIAAVEQRLDDREALHVERFRAAPVADAAPESNEGFDVVCAGSGARVPVDAGVSILEALAGRGVTVPSSCREGICGTCETKVLSGTPEHRDQLLTPQEKESGQTMMLCVSRSQTTELLLDLP